MKFEHTDVFDLRPHDQLASQLMCLPTEIRLKILRLLLVVQGGQLPTAGNGHPVTPYTTNKTEPLSLSSQVLRLCQNLYREAIAILYQDNCPVVDCWGVGGRPQYQVLNSVANYHHSSFFWDLRHLVQDASGSPVVGRDSYKTFPEITETFRILTRFSRIHVICREWQHYIHVSRILEQYTRNKHVTVELARPVYPYEDWCSRALREHRGSPSCFAIWKCKSIKFQQKCTHDDCAMRLAELESIITGTEHIHDLAPAVVELTKTVCHIPGGIQGLGSDRAIDGGLLCRARAAFEENDAEGFEAVGRQILEHAKNELVRHQQSGSHVTIVGAPEIIERLTDMLKGWDPVSLCPSCAHPSSE